MIRKATIGVLAWAVCALACSSDKDSDGSGADGSGASKGQGGASASGGAGPSSGGSGLSSGSGGALSLAQRENSACGLADGSSQVFDGTPPGSYADFEACVSATREADPVSADIFILLDQSVSMGENRVSPSDPASPTRWEALTAALKDFVQSPDSAGLRVGIQYFGLPDPGGGDVSCDPDVYAQPDVAIAELPGNETAMVDSIDAHFPSNLTPTVPALEGALSYAKQWATAHPERPTVLVFATDGYPTECDQRSISDLEALAEQYANPTDGSPKVSTFVMGVGKITNLDRVARAAGTGDAFFVADCPTAVDDLSAALSRVSNSPALCDFEIPEPPEGELLDHQAVNLIFTPRDTGNSEVIYQVSDSGNCAGGGWYYDDNQNPSHVLVCPNTCSRFGSGSAELVLGCATLSVQ